MFSTDEVDREELILCGDRMDAMDTSGELLQCAEPYVQYKCSARFTVFCTSLCAPDKGIEFARKCSSWLRALRDQTWGLKSKYQMMVACCTPGADPVTLESLYGDDRTQDERTDASQLEIDEWLFRAESHLPTWPILADSCIVDVEAHDLRSREDSTVFILVTFDPHMHDMAHRKLQDWLGPAIMSEDSLTIEPLMQFAENMVSNLTTIYREDEGAMESLIQWKFQWLKAFYVSLIVDGVINLALSDMVGKWIGLNISKSRGPVWNGQLFVDKFDMMNSCMDDPSIDHSAPCVSLEVELGSPISFKLKPFKPDARLNDLFDFALPTF